MSAFCLPVDSHCSSNFYNVVGCTVLSGTVVSAFVFLLAAIGSMGTMWCAFKCYKLGTFVQAIMVSSVHSVIKIKQPHKERA